MKKTVLITGASRGIGAATAKKFASNGYNVIINYYSSDFLAKSLKEELENKYDISCEIIKCDISNEFEVQVMFKTIKEKFGVIDILVNNAGISCDNDFREKTAEEFKKVLNINLVGTFLVTKYAIELMKTGSIINVASNSAINDNYPESMDYDASKAGVISLTHNFAKALSPNIKVNAVAPGWINTDMNKDINIDFKTEEKNKIILNRFGESEEVANLIYFLASDEASYINDTIIKVDGGLK